MHEHLLQSLPSPIPGISPHHLEPQASVNYQRTREMTIDELLLENRVIFLVGEINHASAARVMMQMLYLENQKKGQDIQLYINSPGGAVDDTLAIYDTMQFIASEVATFCIGRAYSGGAVLLCSGQKGKRHILPHAKVMIHQPYGGVTGQTSDIQIQAEEEEAPTEGAEGEEAGDAAAPSDSGGGRPPRKPINI